MIKVFSCTLVLFLFASCAQFKKFTKKINEVKDIDTNIFDKQTRKKDYLVSVWAKNLDPVYNSGNRPIGSASPLIQEDFLFMGELSGKMNAYDLSKGSLIWSKDEGQALNSQASFYGDSIVYGSVNGRLFSRKYLTGKLNYAIDLGAAIESAPVMDNGKMFVHLRNHKIVALDIKTGKIFWSYKRSIPYKITLQRVSRPLVYGSSIIVGFADGHLVRFSKLDGSIQWDRSLSKGFKFVDVDLTPVLFKGNLVAGSANGKLSFVNPRNGFVVKNLNAIAGAKPIIVNDELLVGTIFGDIIRFDASGQILSKRKASKFAISSLQSWYDKVVVTTMGEDVLVIDPFTLNTYQSRKLGTEISSVFGTIESDGEYLSLYSSRNRLYVYKLY